MSYLNADGSCIYDHLDDIKIKLSIDQIANLVESSNYGTVRLMAAIIRLRKIKLQEKIKQYRKQDDEEAALYCEKRGDPVSEAFEKLLNDNQY